MKIKETFHKSWFTAHACKWTSLKFCDALTNENYLSIAESGLLGRRTDFTSLNTKSRI